MTRFGALRCSPSENEQYQLAMYEYEQAAMASTAEATRRATGMGGDSSSGSSIKVAPPVMGKGGGADGEVGSFKWSQTVEDLEIICQLPKGTKKGEFKVEVKPQLVRVAVLGEVFKEFNLYAAVRPDEMTFTYQVETSRVTIMIEKREAETWMRLMSAGEGQIV